MTTSLHSLSFAKAHDTTGAISVQIAIGFLMTAAAAILLLIAVFNFGADAAASDSFNLIATF